LQGLQLATKVARKVRMTAPVAVATSLLPDIFAFELEALLLRQPGVAPAFVLSLFVSEKPTLYFSISLFVFLCIFLFCCFKHFTKPAVLSMPDRFSF
jgi:hypothetical protein